jgi:hypothetical protein
VGRSSARTNAPAWTGSSADADATSTPTRGTAARAGRKSPRRTTRSGSTPTASKGNRKVVGFRFLERRRSPLDGRTPRSDLIFRRLV